MKQKNLPIIALVVVLGIWGVLLYNYLGLRKVPSKPVTPTSIGEQPTLSPTQAVIEEKIAEVRQEGGTIPFDYEVISISGETAEITGLKGKVTLVNDPTIKVFFKEGDLDTPAIFADLKVGQKLVIEKSAPPAREFKVFIVSQ